MNEQEILNISENIINNNEFALIGTLAKRKFPNIRALKIMKREGLNKFYFSTKCDSDKIRQMKKHKKGCIYFYDMITFTFNNVLIEGIFKVEQNSTFGISNFYKLANEPYEFCTIIFEAKKLYLYVPYKKYIIDLEKKIK